MGTMNRRRAIPLVAALACFSAAPASAACYESMVMPAHIQCAGNSSASADFGSSCTAVPDSFYEVEVECPAVSQAGGGGQSGSYYDGADNSVQDAGDRN
jgi:hypothetical protein